MEKSIKNIILRLPNWLLYSKVVQDFLQRRNRKFFKITDQLKGNYFWLFCREDSFMERIIVQHGLYEVWEKESLKIWACLAKQSSVIIDIGANTGIYSILAFNHNPSASIIALEPVPLNFSILKKNVTKNNAPITILNTALSESNGSAKMYMIENKLNYMTSLNQDRYELHPEIQGGNRVVQITVPTINFNELLRKSGVCSIDLIKIDVEGHELTVVSNMLPYIEKYRPNILLEVIGEESADQLNILFTKLGYKFVSINEVSRSIIVEKLWDNDHHNFLLCSQKEIDVLRSHELIV